MLEYYFPLTSPHSHHDQNNLLSIRGQFAFIVFYIADILLENVERVKWFWYLKAFFWKSHTSGLQWIRKDWNNNPFQEISSLQSTDYLFLHIWYDGWQLRLPSIDRWREQARTFFHISKKLNRLKVLLLFCHSNITYISQSLSVHSSNARSPGWVCR